MIRSLEMDTFQIRSEECDCSAHIRATLILLLVLSLLGDCVSTCKSRRRLVELETENKTLRTLILQTVDKTLVKMMKNGNNVDNNDDE
jgi:hypothetical protein